MSKEIKYCLRVETYIKNTNTNIYEQLLAAQATDIDYLIATNKFYRSGCLTNKSEQIVGALTMGSLKSYADDNESGLEFLEILKKEKFFSEYETLHGLTNYKTGNNPILKAILNIFCNKNYLKLKAAIFYYLDRYGGTSSNIIREMVLKKLDSANKHSLFSNVDAINHEQMALTSIYNASEYLLLSGSYHI